MYITDYWSPLGKIVLATNGQCLIGAWFETQKYFPDLTLATFANKPIFDDAKYWLDTYFSGITPNTYVPLLLIGTPFRKLVWHLLMQIPYGEITTYGTLASQIASSLNRSRMSAQSVGNAIGHNPLSIFIPCHRVIGADGSLVGYAGGIERKAALLKLEHVLH